MGGITINGIALNNACTYSDPPSGARRRTFPANVRRVHLLSTGGTSLHGSGQPILTALPVGNPPVETCSLEDAEDPASGFHGGTRARTSSGEMSRIIIKHVGSAVAGTNRHALHLRSAGSSSIVERIQIYSVDGSGVRMDGGGVRSTNIVVYNPQMHGLQATNGYIGTVGNLLISQADGAGEACLLVEGGVGGETQAEINDGMNTRLAVSGLTCDFSADNAGGAGAIVTEGAFLYVGDAIIVGSRVAADSAAADDNVCLDLVGERSTLVVDGVIVSCLEVSGVIGSADSFGSNSGAPRAFPEDAITGEMLILDIQFHAPGAATTVSPLASMNTDLIVLSGAGIVEGRALVSLLLSESTVNGNSPPTVANSGARNSQDFIGVQTADESEFDWTFGIFTN